MASEKQKQVTIDYDENKELNYKIKFSVLKVLVIVLAVFLAVTWLKSFFTLEVVLDEETQARLDKDTEHAVDDAKKYLEEKYNIEYELNTFEPVIYALSSETSWDRTHYDGNWRGEFTIDGVSYQIEGNVPMNQFGDNYQTEQIWSACKELVKQYFPDTYENNGAVCEAEYKVGLFSGSHIYGDGLFSTYYDGSNLEELLPETSVGILIDIDKKAAMSDEFWLECEEAASRLEKDFEESSFGITEGVLSSETAYGKWKDAQRYNH